MLYVFCCVFVLPSILPCFLKLFYGINEDPQNESTTERRDREVLRSFSKQAPPLPSYLAQLIGRRGQTASVEHVTLDAEQRARRLLGVRLSVAHVPLGVLAAAVTIGAGGVGGGGGGGGGDGLLDHHAGQTRGGGRTHAEGLQGDVRRHLSREMEIKEAMLYKYNKIKKKTGTAGCGAGRGGARDMTHFIAI